MSINIFHSSKWKFKFSNVPTVTENLDLNIYDNYVKKLTIPSVNIDTIESVYKGNAIHHPLQRANLDLDPISIEFTADEDLQNYFYLFDWAQKLKYGQNTTAENIRDLSIGYIHVILLDNEKREKRRLSFSHAICKSLSSLSLDMGSDEEVTFTATFVYQEISTATL